MSPFQRELLELWLPDARVVADRSWGLTGTTVLQVESKQRGRFIVKAGNATDHHMPRELRAYEQWVPILASIGRAPRMFRGHAEAKLLAVEFLAGELVEGGAAEGDSESYRQAGELLTRLHGQSGTLDDGAFERRQREEALEWLRGPHRIDASDVERLVEHIEAWPAPPSLVVPTHGDWHPRNWMIDGGLVKAIDFGRAALRPAHTDFARLASKQFREDPLLELAFLEGYGADPREPEAWLRTRIREAVATAAWARKVGDEAFEAQGLRMVAEVVRNLTGALDMRA